MTPSARRLRALTLTAAGALAVHQLRYLLTYRGGADHSAATQGHAYLMPVMALALALAVLVLAGFIARAARGRDAGGAVAPSGRRLWVGASATLLSLYVLQEGLEGWLAADHPAGMTGVFGQGGWVALPLVVVVGALIALALRGSVVALEPAGWRLARRRRRAEPHLCDPAPRWAKPALDVLARFLAARGPPVVCA